MHATAAADTRERTIIIGSGMGGLATALALKHSGRELLIVERDPAPPELEPSSAFEHWKRPGVPQLRHTHIFLARFQAILRAHHPELLEELFAAGVELSRAEEALPTALLPHFAAQPDDVKLLHLWSRRATLEYVLRRHVARLPHVRFVHGEHVERLITDSHAGQVRVTGIELRRADDSSHQLQADIVIDASGVRSPHFDRLKERGAPLRTERVPAPCGYYCRHFQQRAAQPSELTRDRYGGTLDYLVYGVFFAEHGGFSVAFACAEFESELMEQIKRPAGFDEACRQIPAIARWLERAEPVSRVLGGADLANRWQHYPRSGPAQLLGFFPVGDSYIQTNPIYGRGCSSAFVQAHALAEALASSPDPRQRAQRYHDQTWKLLRHHFDFCTGADAAFLARAKHARGGTLSLKERLASRAYERVFLPALDESSFVTREWWKMQQMSEASPPYVFLLVLLELCLRWLVRSFRGRRWQLPELGPSRERMLAACLAHAGAEEAGRERNVDGAVGGV
jgi:2-polyprenyl-6-methoxyphenol hydroxylase-like FAD-dependent oxidoreductase